MSFLWPFLQALVPLLAAAPTGDAYHWTPLEGGVLSASNRAHGIRSCYSPMEGLRVTPDASHGGWRFELRTAAFGREGDVLPIEVGRLARHGERFVRDALTIREWFVNDARGVEQGWTIPSPPPGDRSAPLTIDLQLTGLRAELDESGDGAFLVDEEGARVLHYGGLRAWDAAGEDLPAHLIATERGLVVQVVDAGATYPLEVDPVLVGPAWLVEGNYAGGLFGTSLTGAGDVNGDGFADVLVGAPGFDAGHTQSGRVFLYFGTPTGLSTTVGWTADGDQFLATLGTSVAAAGDVNGDGYDDFLVGAAGYDNRQTDLHDVTHVSCGRVFLYLGSPTGPSKHAAWSAFCDQEGAWYGRSLAGAGDVNADGYDDVVVGATHYSHGQVHEGRAFLYLGSASGLSALPAWTAEGDQVDAYFGIVDGAGDVNGDGFDDVVVGAPGYDLSKQDEGRVLLYFGSPSGLSASPGWLVGSGKKDAGIGSSIAGAGDVNGDGFADLVVGAPYYHDGQVEEGRAYLFLGSSSGPAGAPDWTFAGGQEHARYGRIVAGAGDVDGDGFDDVIVASSYVNGLGSRGRVFVHLGSIHGLSAAPDAIVDDYEPHTVFADSMSAAGDVNGDHYDDVVLGDWIYMNGQADEGRALLYAGAPIEDCNGNGVDDGADITNGTSDDFNGNGVPDDCETLGHWYCPSSANSTGSPAVLVATGSASSSAGDLSLSASPVPNELGLFCHGMDKVHVPFGDGFLCVTGDVRRGEPVVAAGQRATYLYDNSVLERDLSAFVGTTRHLQYWFRDAAAGASGFNTSNALSLHVLP